jgi:hypothetical protein
MAQSWRDERKLSDERKAEDTRGRRREDGGMMMHADQMHVDVGSVRRLVEVEFRTGGQGRGRV